jgi:hypothetical protein
MRFHRLSPQAAGKLQRDLEDQGFPVSVFNVTKGVEEYRTGENLEAE